MNNQLKLCTVVCLLAFFSACQKVEIQKKVANRAIVHSFLLPNQKIQMQVSRELAFGQENSNVDINNLSIQLSSEDETETMDFSDAGRYTSKNIVARENKIYQFSFQYNGLRVSSTTTVPSKPVNFTIKPLTLKTSSSNDADTKTKLKWSNPESDYYYVSIKNIEANPTPIASTTGSNSGKSSKNVESLVSQGFSEEISLKYFNYYGTHQIILFHIQPDYAVYYKDYSSTSSTVTAPPSNISNGLGIFTGINADTVLVQVQK